MSDVATASTAYQAILSLINKTEPRVGAAIAQELGDQRESLKLIASENYASLTTPVSYTHLTLPTSDLV